MMMGVENPMELLTKIRELGDYHAIDYIGVADIGPIHQEIADIGGTLHKDYQRALAIGIALPDAIVKRLAENGSYEDALTYNEHAYHIINNRLDLFASMAASVIGRAGHMALPLPAAERIDSQRVCASMSHKITARLAGFGWIGKSCLLITPEHGPRVRWTTVLTDAPLKVSGEVMEVQCGSCRACAEVCPAQALTGENYHEGEPREMRLDVNRCEAYLRRRREETSLAVCGLCLAVCPYGMGLT